MSDTVEKKLEEYFRQTGLAHHRAFLASNGTDPEWPMWFAEHLQDRVNALSGRAMTRSELVYHIIAAERERMARQPDADWPGYYAHYLRAQMS